MSAHEPRLAIDGGPAARSRADTYRVLTPGASWMDGAEENAVIDVVRRRILYRYWGSTVSEFERELAASLGEGVTALAVNSGSSALQLAFAALGLPIGTEVLIPTWGFLSAATAALNAGLVPRFVPVDRSLAVDVNAAAELVTPRTGAILAVHPFGSACDLDALCTLARQASALVVEDVAQAHGGEYCQRPLGTIGDIAAFSLQFFKLVSTGEGGAVITRHAELYARAYAMHDASALWTAPSLLTATDRLAMGPGNLRMSEIEGALGLVQLRRLDRLVSRMRTIKAELDNSVADTGTTLRPHADAAGDVGTALIFYCKDAAAAQRAIAALRAEGVGAVSLLGAPGVNRHWAGNWGPTLKRCGIDPPAPALLDRDRDGLEAGVLVGIDPRYSATDVAETRLALEKVLGAAREQ